MKVVNVDQEKLTRMWCTYINDSSVFTKQTFGQYTHDRIMQAGWCWPDLFYSDNKAYDLIHGYIRTGTARGLREVTSPRNYVKGISA